MPVKGAPTWLIGAAATGAGATRGVPAAGGR